MYPLSEEGHVRDSKNFSLVSRTVVCQRVTWKPCKSKSYEECLVCLLNKVHEVKMAGKLYYFKRCFILQSISQAVRYVIF